MKKKFPGVTTDTANNGYQYTAPWLGSVMGKNHSMIQKVKQIAETHIMSDMTTVSVVGKEGVGKSTIAILIAHMLHQEFEKFAKKELTQTDPYLDKQILSARKGYIVKVLTREDLMRFSEVLQELPNVNRILLFDDISFIKKNLSSVKQQVTEIRHSGGSVDLKHLIVYGFHYGKSFDKYLRDTHFTIQASGSFEEFKNLSDMMGGGKKGSRIASLFIQKYTELPSMVKPQFYYQNQVLESLQR